MPSFYDLIENPEITEILIQGENRLFYELKGSLYESPEIIEDLATIRDEILWESKLVVDLEFPFGNGVYRNHRLHWVAQCYTGHQDLITLRKMQKVKMSLNQMIQQDCAPISTLPFLENLIHEKKNVLVIGTTGSGKTTVLQGLLMKVPETERVVILEDTSELLPPNAVSLKLLTREPSVSQLPRITLTDLVRESLRMRPDRLVLGEVRGSEAKDLLLAWSTGHTGSLASLHASSAQQALSRLEMLVQMGAPQWSLETVRKLIHLSLDYVIHVGKDQLGRRKLLSIASVAGLESFGLLTETLYQDTIPENYNREAF